MLFVRDDVPYKANHRREAFGTERAIAMIPDRLECGFVRKEEATAIQMLFDKRPMRFAALNGHGALVVWWPRSGLDGRGAIPVARCALAGA